MRLLACIIAFISADVAYSSSEVVTPAGFMVTATVICEGDVCDHVRASTQLAMQFITNVIAFKKVVDLHVVYQPCYGVGCNPSKPAVCSTKIDTLADENGHEQLFPRALSKQLGLEIPYQPIDVKISFNSLLFPSEASKWQADQIRFLCLLNHEIIHGLGLVSSYLPDVRGFLHPQMYPSLVNDNFVTKFYDTPFDSHTHLLPKMTLTNFTKTLNELPYIPFLKSQNATALRQTKHYSLFRLFNNLLTRHRSDQPVYFNASNQVIQLDTSLSPFQPGVSLVHLLNPQPFDTLMSHSTDYSHFKDLLRDSPDWAQSPYGPQTLAILETLGYTINPNPNLTLSMSHYYKSTLTGLAN
ncbi:hypothetical protein DSO57_1002488 [Entomophthora muscae]|uniref:Uncharacterized protein n=1 Tax=Entomophthora muscae TaxID=34485 RepID=A0ACC2SLG7_9FUNG|nr:hypothetical protein DSO57_1002488 [Entomophthora muscae]